MKVRLVMLSASKLKNMHAVKTKQDPFNGFSVVGHLQRKQFHFVEFDGSGLF